MKKDTQTHTLLTRARDRDAETPYSTLSSHRNRPAGGSQSISKCAREIGPTVSQFLNVQ